MELIHEFDLAATVKPAVTLRSRMFLEIAEGKVTGERLNGTLLSGGGDWITLGPTGGERLTCGVRWSPTMCLHLCPLHGIA